MPAPNDARAPDNAPALDDFTDPADSDADSPVMPREMEDFAVPAAVVDAAPVRAAVPPPPPVAALNVAMTLSDPLVPIPVAELVSVAETTL